jgi:hypothetical protein
MKRRKLPYNKESCINCVNLIDGNCKLGGGKIIKRMENEKNI